MLSVLNISDNQLILIIGAYSVFSIPLFTPLHVDAAVPVGLAGTELRGSGVTSNPFLWRRLEDSETFRLYI